MSRNSLRSRLLHGAVIGLASALMACVLAWAGLFDSWEAVTFDIRARLLARERPTAEQIRLILLDQKSLDWASDQLGLGWPWPRELYSPITDFCARGGARSLAFDVVFTEPSVYGVSDDERMAASLRSFPGSVLPLALSDSEGTDQGWPSNVPFNGLTFNGLALPGLDDWQAAHPDAPLARATATFPIPVLAEAVRLMGNVTFSPDADTVYRALPLVERFAGSTAPCLGLAAYLAGNKDTQMRLEDSALVVDAVNIDLDGRGRALLNYLPRGSFTAYSAAAVIQSELRLLEGGEPSIDPADLAGKYVFFGFSATGLLDLRHTPLGGVTPGVVIHATALENLLADAFMARAPAWLAPLLTLLLAVATAAFMTGTSRTGLATLANAVALGLPLGLALLAYLQGWWLEFVLPEAATAMALFGAGTYKYATEGRQKRFIRSAFSQYLSPEVISRLIANPDLLSLGGERRELTIFFSDLQGFTSISENLDPESLTSVLNDYLSAMTDIIHEEGGTVDKYEGDAIIAFWNAPLDQPDHALRCVRAALRCQARLAELRPEFLKRTGKPFFMRIGMNTGPAVVGNLGSRTRFDYTMLGDAVNLAARLEGVNKVFATYTMISDSTLGELGGAIPCRELGRVRVVGKLTPVRIFEPLDADQARERSTALALFHEALELYYAGKFDQARDLFRTLPDDPAAEKYAAECARLADDPPRDWDGVWIMAGK